jgi:hypothetical protein
VRTPPSAQGFLMGSVMAKTAPTVRPSVFVGSSSEGLEIAQIVQVLLDRSSDVVLWNQGVFGLSEGTLESLVVAHPQFDFAVLVLTADDIIVSRGTEHQTARDNVLFELGLFMGGLGRDRTFILYDRADAPKIPSDLAGVTPATFQRHASGNLQASLGAPCTIIELAIKKHGVRTGRLRRANNIQITCPIDGGILEDQQPRLQGFSYVVRGTLDQLPEDHAIWLLNASRDGRQWPQGGFTVRYPYPGPGEWEGRIYLPYDQPETIINAVVAPPTSRQFFEYYQRYGGGKAPLARIPIECKDIAQVSVKAPPSHKAGA